MSTDIGYVLRRPPVTKDELWWTVKALWGVAIPKTSVCPGHTSPFDAFAEGYFGNHANWVLWYGSRGTGKSYLLALLALTKAALMDINVTLLGGSMAQSENVAQHVEALTNHHNAPTWAISRAIKTELSFVENWIRPLPASQKTVRGPHPQMTCLDEIDEMERPIYDAAMGQAMAKENTKGIVVPEMIVASSTWQNPIGTFQEIKEEAEAKGLPIRTWCWREVVKPHGWMDADFIERKRLAVSAEMFRVEYDLGEPSGGSRAFDLEALNRATVHIPTVNELHKTDYDVWTYETFQPTGSYVIGADWAKERDKTVIVVVRIDVEPAQVVKHIRISRRPWPEMTALFNQAMQDYQAIACHDGTGIGNVVHDLIDERASKVVLVGRERQRFFNEYIAAVENGQYAIPAGTPLLAAHKGTTVTMIYESGKYNAHMPDDIVAMAAAHRAHVRGGIPTSGQSVPKPNPDLYYPDLETPKSDDERRWVSSPVRRLDEDEGSWMMTV